MARKASAPATRRPLSGQIRDVIEARGITPTELGRLSGVDPTVIARFASGEREVRSGTLDRIAAALHLRVVEDAPPGPRGRRAAT